MTYPVWWLGPLNQYLLQWFCIRLEVTVEGRKPVEKPRNIKSWAIIYPIVPLTGWWSNYMTFGFRMREKQLWHS